MQRREFLKETTTGLVAVGIGANLALIQWGRRRAAPLPGLAEAAPALEKDGRPIDRRLLAGSALFGLGWGISGFCPGPAITSMATAAVPVFVFIGAMIAGMVLHRYVPAAWRRARAHLSSAAVDPIGEPAPEGTSCG